MCVRILFQDNHKSTNLQLNHMGFSAFTTNAVPTRYVSKDVDAIEIPVGLLFNVINVGEQGSPHQVQKNLPSVVRENFLNKTAEKNSRQPVEPLIREYEGQKLLGLFGTRKR